MPRPKTKHEFDENVEKILVAKLAVNEYETHKAYNAQDNRDFETYVALLDGDRPEKEYDWMSDISLGDFFSHVATQSSLDVSQYFQTKDFVECYAEDSGDEAVRAADANKELINRTLNRRDLYHFFRFVRGKLINNLNGHVWAHCWWEQETKEDVIGIRRKVEELNVDVLGEPIIDRENQIPQIRLVEEPVRGTVPIIDQFNYEILDPRNIVTDNKYVYSAQQKDFIWIRRERSLDQLIRDADVEGYFNLHLLKEKKPAAQTETARETSDRKQTEISPDVTKQKIFDVYKRYGRYWAIIKERMSDGYPLRIIPGIDDRGEIKTGAEWIEVVQAYAGNGPDKILIAFHPTPYRDHKGIPFKPVIRGLCYIHPTRDNGIGDGQVARELSCAIDDTFNVSQDRTMLATLPTFKGKKYVTEDNNSIYMEPEHVMELENPREDLLEMEISDNTQAAMGQIQVLTTKMDQGMAVYPTTMGDLPAHPTTTATAVVGAQGQTSNRTNYKSMTYEHTFLTELYWQITQMTKRFAYPQTGFKLMGDKAKYFRPDFDYMYKPLSQSIESEQSKMAKIRMWDQIMAKIAGIQHPDTVKMINFIFTKECELMGDEYVNFANAFLNTQIPVQQGNQGSQPAEGGGMQGKPSNQYQIPMSPEEGGAREMGGI